MAKARATIADVAREAGVSKGLVSFALNDRPGVSAHTRDRILAVAKDLGWSPSVRARSLSSDRAFALGVVIARNPEILSSDPFFPALIAGIETALAPVGQALVLSMVGDADAETASYRQLAAHGRVDGVIITDLRLNDPRLALVEELGLAAVTLGRPDIPSPFPSVNLDDAPGIRDAVRHLADLGHVRIAHVAGPATMLHGARRREAFDAALRELGLDAGPDGCLVIETDFSAADGARATRELLALPERPTAIVYSNDPMAIAGMGVAQRDGLRVPEDLSVTGFDDSDVGRHINPSLTTVSTAAQVWGEAAATALLRVVSGEQIDHIELSPALLVVRESTGPRPGTTTRPPEPGTT
ncbi:MAG: LacI family DNA-binding transcriptional regulator [Burkholderiaceae bacterium]|nr:LacI family DNA-binding transcriptional regulator [Microbacteriaceae bacterium]